MERNQTFLSVLILQTMAVSEAEIQPAQPDTREWESGWMED